MRLLFVLLIVAVVFLSGTVFGMKQENQQADVTPDLIETQEESEKEVETEVPVETISLPVTEPEIDDVQGMESTLNIASLLETGVKSFFELIMQAMYQTAQLFF